MSVQVGSPAADADVLRAAKQPVGSGPTPLVGVVTALLLGALGVAGVQEALVRTGLISDRSWISRVVEVTDGRAATFALLVGSCVLALVGLWLLLLVFRRRPRTTIALRARTGVYLRGQDLGPLAETLVQGADGVTDVEAHSTSSRLRLRVRTIEPASGNADLERRVRERVAPALDALETRLKVSVDIVNTELT